MTGLAKAIGGFPLMILQAFKHNNILALVGKANNKHTFDRVNLSVFVDSVLSE
jgi:hypothetical protein